MGFKADTSFLRFLSMGAVGVKQTMEHLSKLGFHPIELERYCGSNKIWATKVKRLRLPDVLCVRTGLRLEIRAKSALTIKMSDAENNPDRRWDVGLRSDDVIAFIAVRDVNGLLIPADKPVFFDTGALRESVDTSRLGPPKSASEGAERDRTWPASVPKKNGRVLAVDRQKISTELIDAEGKTRRQSFPLRGGKHSYVSAGDRFEADVSIIAGTPVRMANLKPFLGRIYDPLGGLESENQLDRYAAAKALPYREELRLRAVLALERLLDTEREKRVLLEAAGSAAKLGSHMGEQKIIDLLDGNDKELPFLPMEAVFILTELKTEFAKTQLVRLASDTALQGDERRQAAVWGLGKAGLRAYASIVPLIADQDENVAMHAMTAFGSDIPEAVLELLVNNLLIGEPRRAAAASEALRLSANETSVRLLMDAARTPNEWALATLGRLPIPLVRPAIVGTDLEAKLAPMLLLSEGAHWLSSEERVLDIAFLVKQNLY
jgi:HEAT repeat protein